MPVIGLKVHDPGEQASDQTGTPAVVTALFVGTFLYRGLRSCHCFSRPEERGRVLLHPANFWPYALLNYTGTSCVIIIAFRIFYKQYPPTITVMRWAQHHLSNGTDFAQSHRSGYS